MPTGGESFIIKQWQNRLTFDPTSNSTTLKDALNGNGFNGQFGQGGGYHVTDSTDSSDVVPITIVGHTGDTTYNNSGSETDNLGAGSLSANGYCNSCPAPSGGFSGNGSFIIYAQLDGSVTNTLGTGVTSNPQAAGSGLEIELVYLYSSSTAPEPGSLLLLGSGLALAGRLLRKRMAARS